MFDVFLSGVINQNLNLFYLINGGMDNYVFDFLMPLITNFGSLFAWCLGLLLIYIFGGKFGRKVALLGLAGLFLSNMIVILLKYVVAEPRPFLTLPNVDLLVRENGSSFPSGHTASSFAAATIIGLKYHLKSKGKNYWLIYPLTIFAVIVGFSRVYIGVHYPYDVICGAIIGTICALAVLKYENILLNNKIASFFGIDKIINFNIIRKNET
jgi:undecaprenyl-diphosphatase